MRNLTLLVLISLFSTLSFAGWVAQVTGDFSTVDLSVLKLIRAPDGTAFAVTNESVEYPGHYGDYLVSFTITPKSGYMVVSGGDESVTVLSQELYWIAKLGGVPRDVCRNYTIYQVESGGYEACEGKVLVFYCPTCELAKDAVSPKKAPAPAVDSVAPASPPVAEPASEPEGSQPLSEPAPLAATSAGSEPTGISAISEPPSPPEQPRAPSEQPGPVESVAQAVYDTIGGVVSQQYRADARSTGDQNAAGQVGAAGEGAAGQAPPQQEGGIKPEQMLQLLAAFILVIIASYLVISSRTETMMQQADPQAERLLQNETRAGIMQELSMADKIPTDLSNRLGKSKAAVVEHLQELVSAGLVERLETPGRKFVYYRITQKGRQLLLRKAA